MPYTFERSRSLFERAQRSIAGGVNSGIRKMEQPVPLYFTHGKGPRLWDVDGNEYLDFQIGQGAILFGHAPDGLAAAIGAQAGKGTHWAAQSELELHVAEKLQAMMPSAQRIRFNNSATESVMAAFRLARVRTGRQKILKFEGHYHGWSDEGLVGFATPADRWSENPIPPLHPSAGIIPEVPGHFVVTPWNDAAALERAVQQHAAQLAAIVFEPVLCNTSCIEPAPGFLKLIRDLCTKHGIMMIADETITGLRFGAASAQGYYKVQPDLTVMGKAVGGGVPFSVLAGTVDAMEPYTAGRAVHAGTFNANPLCLAASNWSLDHVKSLGGSHPDSVIALGRRLMDGLRQLARRHNVPLEPQGPGLAFHTTVFKPGAAQGPVRDYRDYVTRHDAPRWLHLRLRLLEEGVRAIERGLWFVSLAHTSAEIDEALARADRAFARHANEYRSP